MQAVAVQKLAEAEASRRVLGGLWNPGEMMDGRWRLFQLDRPWFDLNQSQFAEVF